jgi:hypothetical protein
MKLNKVLPKLCCYIGSLFFLTDLGSNSNVVIILILILFLAYAFSDNIINVLKLIAIFVDTFYVR